MNEQLYVMRKEAGVNLLDYFREEASQQLLRKEALSLGDFSPAAIKDLYSAGRQAMIDMGMNAWKSGARRFSASFDKPGLMYKLKRGLGTAQKKVGVFIMEHPDASLGAAGAAGGLGLGAAGLGAYRLAKGSKPEQPAVEDELR